MSLMLLLFGFLFSMLGVVAEYVGLIYEEVKQRPNFVVRTELGFVEDPSWTAGPARPSRSPRSSPAVDRTP